MFEPFNSWCHTLNMDYNQMKTTKCIIKVTCYKETHNATGAATGAGNLEKTKQDCSKTVFKVVNWKVWERQAVEQVF